MRMNLKTLKIIGQTIPTNGRNQQCINLQWMIKPEHVGGVLEGNTWYYARQTAGGLYYINVWQNNRSRTHAVTDSVADYAIKQSIEL